MKILHIISSGGMYGAEAVILNLSRMLNEGSDKSVLGVFSNSPNPNLQLHERALKEGIESYLIPCNGQIDKTVTASIRELVLRTQADVVHAHGYKADVYVACALRATTTPVVSTCHNWLSNNLLVSFYGVVDRFVLRNYDAVVAVSDEVKAQLLKSGVHAKKVHLIGNGIDLRPFEKAIPSLREEGIGKYVLTVGWIGRLSKEKGPDIFLRAVKLVLVECPGTRFVIVGDGPNLDELNILINELGISKNVVLAGRREDMPSVYASFDLLVSSSRQEGLPMAILEGMASGLPLVATAVGDVPTVVLDGRTGVVVPSEDVGSLAIAMIGLLKDASLRNQFGATARKLVKEKFSAERMTADYLHIYNDVVRAKSIEQDLDISVALAGKDKMKRAGK